VDAWEEGMDESHKWEDGKWVGRKLLLVTLVEMYHELNRWVASLENTEMRCLEDLVKWNRENPVRYSP
jgi:hypothetical protein